MSSLAFTCSGEGQIYPGVAGHVLPQVMSDQPHGRIAVRRLMCIPFSRNYRLNSCLISATATTVRQATTMMPSDTSMYITTPPMQVDTWKRLHAHHLTCAAIGLLDIQTGKVMGCCICSPTFLARTQAYQDPQVF